MALLGSDKDWGQQGYKEYSGFAWYRFTIKDPTGDKPLALLLTSIEIRYQVYADGKPIGGNGRLPSRMLLVPRPRVYALPPAIAAESRTGASIENSAGRKLCGIELSDEYEGPADVRFRWGGGGGEREGGLFGFERTQAISTESAGAIAEVAKRFGRQDDISVLVVSFAPVEMAQV
jgi:hypothetical protein